MAETASTVEHFKSSLGTFLANVKQLSERNKVPTWFNEFYKHLSNFSTDFTATIVALEKHDQLLESQLAIQKTVTDRLDGERKKLDDYVNDLEADVEDLRQYSRRTNLLFHGIEEGDRESTDDKIMEVINTKLGLNLTLDDVGRSHRLGRKVENRKRPIIARFVSYRKRKTVFEAKKKLKGTGIVISENLTKAKWTKGEDGNNKGRGPCVNMHFILSWTIICSLVLNRVYVL